MGCMVPVMSNEWGDSMTRLQTERNVWLATVRPSGRPHLVPIWFVWVDERFWICTSASTKTRNIAGNSKVSVALESGNDPIVAEGTAIVHTEPYPLAVAEAFAEKFDWDITQPASDGSYDALIEIVVDRWLFENPLAA